MTVSAARTQYKILESGLARCIIVHHHVKMDLICAQCGGFCQMTSDNAVCGLAETMCRQLLLFSFLLAALVLELAGQATGLLCLPSAKYCQLHLLS